MDRTELCKKLIDMNGGKMLASKYKIMKMLGIGYSRVIRILSDITPMYNTTSSGPTAKLYFLDDVAKEIMRKGI